MEGDKKGEVRVGCLLVRLKPKGAMDFPNDAVKKPKLVSSPSLYLWGHGRSYFHGRIFVQYGVSMRIGETLLRTYDMYNYPLLKAVKYLYIERMYVLRSTKYRVDNIYKYGVQTTRTLYIHTPYIVSRIRA